MRATATDLDNTAAAFEWIEKLFVKVKKKGQLYPDACVWQGFVDCSSLKLIVQRDNVSKMYWWVTGRTNVTTSA